MTPWWLNFQTLAAAGLFCAVSLGFCWYRGIHPRLRLVSALGWGRVRRTLPLAAVALVLLSSRGAARELRLEAWAEHASEFQVFFSHRGVDFSEVDSTRRTFGGRPDFQTLRFPLPDWPDATVRLDPGSQPGKLRLRNVGIWEGDRLLVRIPPGALEPARDLVFRAKDISGEAFLAEVPAGHNDPILLVNVNYLSPQLSGTRLVTKGTFLVLMTLLGVAGVAAACWALRWTRADGRSAQRQQLWGALAVGLLLIGTKLWTMQGAVSWAPYLDQFEGDFAAMILPYQQGTLAWSEFTAPHNDHRVATTRAALLLTFVLNGEWDNRVLTVLMYLVQGLTLAWFAWLVLKAGANRLSVSLIAVAGLASLAPNDWENQVSGFQLAFHLTQLFSFVAMGLLISDRGAPARWLGLLAGILAVLSLGSGFLALTAGVGGLVFVALLHRRIDRSTLLLAGVAAVIVTGAWFWRARFAAHDSLQARDLAQWLFGLWTYGGWPFPPKVYFFVGLWLPWTCLGLRNLWRGQTSSLELFILVLGLWLLLQSGGLAWGRGAFAPVTSSRYTGMLEWHLVVAIASLVLLSAPTAARSRGANWAWAGLCAAFAVATLGQQAWRAHTTYRLQFQEFTELTREHERRLSAFMQTDDSTLFTSVPFPHTPFPYTDKLLFLLRNPTLRSVLPAPLRRDQIRLTDPALLSQIHAGPLTQVARALFHTGPLFLLAGLGALAWHWLRSRSERLKAASTPLGNPGRLPDHSA